MHIYVAYKSHRRHSDAKERQTRQRSRVQGLYRGKPNKPRRPNQGTEMAAELDNALLLAAREHDFVLRKGTKADPR